MQMRIELTIFSPMSPFSYLIDHLALYRWLTLQQSVLSIQTPACCGDLDCTYSKPTLKYKSPPWCKANKVVQAWTTSFAAKIQ